MSGELRRYSLETSQTSQTSHEQGDNNRGQQTGDMQAEIQRRIDGNPVVVMATSTCLFCVEAKRTLAAHGITGHFVDMDKEADSSEMRKATSTLAGNSTSVPQIWINKKYIGGCGDLKALDATGDLRLRLNGIPGHIGTEDVEEGLKEKPTGVSMDSAVAIYPGPRAAFLSSFHSPATVDNRVVRLNGVMTCVLAVFAAAIAELNGTQWLVLGLLVDFALKFAGFPSPLSLLAALPFAGTKPHYTAGAPQQFANLCGVVIALVAWVCLVRDKASGGFITLAVLAGVAFLQGFLGFCAGCFVFECLVKWGLISKSVYRMHTSTRADLLRPWEKASTPTGKAISPEAVKYPTPGLPSNPTDLCAKPAKASEKRQRFHLIKYCHITYFLVPLSVLGLALPWAILARPVGMVTVVWQTLAWTGVTLDVILGTLFLAKCVLYPSKVKKEWNHPVSHNAFAVPFITLIFMAWMSTMWSGDSTGSIATVLFWMGAAPLSSITLITIASWIAFPVDEEFINPTWIIIPVGNLAGAVTAMLVDTGDEYIEWAWFQFSVGVLLWLALWPITFRKAVLSNHSDSRVRNLYGVWVAPPAMAMLAFTALDHSVEAGPVQCALFYASLAMALVLSVCIWPVNFFEEGGFDMTNWAFAFPLNALAAAAVTMYDLSHNDTMRVLYMVALTAACLVNTVNMLFTLGALKAKKLFTPAVKWSPLAFLVLTHQAFRGAVQNVSKLSAAVKPGVEEASSLRRLAAAWSSMSKAYRVHSMHEDKVVFPVLEGFFPGQTRIPAGEHEEHEKLMSTIQTAFDTLLSATDGGSDKAARAKLFEELKVNLSTFEKLLIDHLDHEELFFASPVARKYLPLQTVKDLVRDSWNATPSSDMSELVGWVMANLRARGLRTRFLKTWVWAMPERAQQLGLMVYRKVDDVTWVEVARDLPEAIPRGLPGYRRYF